MSLRLIILIAHQVLIPIASWADMSPQQVKYFNENKLLAEKGDAIAQYNLHNCYSMGVGVSIDKVESTKWNRKAADQGLIWAQYDLGLDYANGIGIQRDLVEATIWFRKAAEQGWDFAQYELSKCYADGTGVAKDEVEAYAWLNISAFDKPLYSQQRRAFIELEKTLSRDEIAAGQKRSKELQEIVSKGSAASKKRLTELYEKNAAAGGK
jgi:TPR repeat protein